MRNAVVKIIAAEVANLKAVYLFGSRSDDAKYVTKSSDYDLAYFASHKLSLGSSELLNLRIKLANFLDVDSVDLIDAGATDDHVLQQNIIDGKRLWVKKGFEDAVLEWEAKRLTIANDWWEGERDLREAYIERLKKRIL